MKTILQAIEKKEKNYDFTNGHLLLQIDSAFKN